VKDLLMDLFLLVEVCWCTIFAMGKSLREGLLYIGGFITSSYVASQVSPWMAHTFSASAGAVVTWLSDTVITSAQSVGLAVAAIPPESVLAADISHAKWVAIHVFFGLLGTTITLAVFCLFLMIGHLTIAVWDLPQHKEKTRHILRIFVALGCGLFVAVETMETIANLSWFSWFQPFAGEASRSIFFQSVSFVIGQWDGHYR
jgi:hypothetical protein